ncbi:site-specific integrase [bacterium CPR1]|nr:site-specific integrase [bacterium CPR1]
MGEIRQPGFRRGISGVFGVGTVTRTVTPISSSGLPGSLALKGEKTGMRETPGRYGAGGPVGRGRRRFSHRVWRPALKRAKIKNLRIHDLRHTFCSRLVEKGAGLRTVQLLAGHKSFTTTERYAHLAPDHLRDAVETLVTASPARGGKKT